jgi:hypothetical protein
VSEPAPIRKVTTPHPTQRASVSNDPLALPRGLLLTTHTGRRWRDLAVTWAAQLGERMAREDVRARVRALIWLTVELERLHDERLCDKPVPLHTLLHMTQEQRTLIAELGLGLSGSERDDQEPVGESPGVSLETFQVFRKLIHGEEPPEVVEKMWKDGQESQR